MSDLESDLEKAIRIATEAHRGQMDKGGQPYILHVLRVMLTQKTEEARIAAVLHDVVEDTAWTHIDLVGQGFPSASLLAIVALTRRDGEPYPSYVARAGRNPMARGIKMADLRDNMDPNRPGAERLQQRYEEALGTLMAGVPALEAQQQEPQA